MKKIIILMALIGAGFGSCSVEVDDIFEETAAERYEAAKAEFLELLLSPEKGWIIKYFPGDTRQYGGYNLLAKFEADGTVTMASERSADVSQTETSTYDINFSQSACLTFDTYNEMIHYWCDPSLSEGAGVQYGFEGDFEFVYQYGDTEQIVTKGKKRGSYIVFTKFPTDLEWTDYLQDVVDLKAEMVFSFYNLIFNGKDQVTTTLDDNRYQVLYYNHPDEPNPDIYENIPFIYTNDGLQFYEPLTLFGVEVRNFVYDSESRTFTCTDPGVDAVIECRMVDGYLYYEDVLGDWTLYYATQRGGETTSTITVTMVENVYKESFYLTGLDYDIYIAYNKTNSVMSLWNVNGGRTLPGYTYNVGGVDYQAFFNVVNNAGSYYLTSTSYGMVSVNTVDDDGNPKLSWVDNGSSTMESFIFSYVNASGSRVIFSRYYGPLTMVKK